MLYYHSKASEGTNRVTVGGDYCEEGLCLVASRTSNKDNFCRKKGRELVERRFKVRRHCITIPVEERNGKTFLDIASKLAALISKDIKFKENIASYKL